MSPNLLRLRRHLTHSPPPARPTATAPLLMAAALSAPLLTVSTAALLALLAPGAHAAAVYAEHWDSGVSTEGWGSASVVAQVLPNAVVGQPPGSIASVYMPDGLHAPVIGAYSGQLPLSGDFRGHTWQVSFDAMLAAGPLEAFSLRYGVYDTGGGWRLPLALPDAGVWTHYEVWFDPDWSDEQASAAGWVKELGVWDWHTSMGVVTFTELRAELAANATTALMYFDNYVQQHGSTVPTPGTAALMLLALAMLHPKLTRRTR